MTEKWDIRGCVAGWNSKGCADISRNSLLSIQEKPLGEIGYFDRTESGRLRWGIRIFRGYIKNECERKMSARKSAHKINAIHDAKIRGAVLIRDVDPAKPDLLHIAQFKLNS